MSEEERHKEIANSVLVAVVKELRVPLWAVTGFVAAQLISFLFIGVADHFALKDVQNTVTSDVQPKVNTLWDEHWKNEK